MSRVSRSCVRAAARLFAVKGTEGVTMRELASALGVSAMTPYRYFRDKDDILAAVRARASTALPRHSKCLCRSRPVLERAKPSAKPMCVLLWKESATYRLMFDLSQPTEDQYPDLVRAMTRARATMTSHVRDLIAEGILSGDPELIGHVFWAVLHGAVTLHLAGKLSSQYKQSTQYGIDQILSEAIHVLGEGYRAKR